MRRDTVEYLKRLKDATQQACDEALDRSHEFADEAINWGDLGCVRAEYTLDDQGDVGYGAWIEEAAPQSAKLCAFIGQRLQEMGHKDVRVRCEW